jgi:hypothetical protein
MLRKFSSRIAAHRSAESPKKSPQSSNQPSHSSTPARKSSVYGSGYAEQEVFQKANFSDRAPYSATSTPRTSDAAPYSTQTPRSSDRAPYSATGGTRHTSDVAPYLSTRTPHSSDQPPKSLSQTQTPRSSASAPRNTAKHFLSPPPPNTPYDEAAWAKHDYLLYSVSTRAATLDRLALAVEARWRAAEAALPPSQHHTIGRAAHIPMLREVHLLLARIDYILKGERQWRREWKPPSPMLKYPAWGNVYGEAMGVHSGEGVALWDVVSELNRRVEGMLEKVKRM